MILWCNSENRMSIISKKIFSLLALIIEKEDTFCLQCFPTPIIKNTCIITINIYGHDIKTALSVR